MKYFLRNEEKIYNKLGAECLDKIKYSLDMFFKTNMIIRCKEVPGLMYPIFEANGILFYVVSRDGSLYRVAFKEFTNK